MRPEIVGNDDDGGGELSGHGWKLVAGFDRDEAPEGWTRVRALTTLHGVRQPDGGQETVEPGDETWAPTHVVDRLERRDQAEVIDDEDP